MADPIPVTISLTHSNDGISWAFEISPDLFYPQGNIFGVPTHLLVMPHTTGTLVTLLLTLQPDTGDTATFNFDSDPSHPDRAENAVTWMPDGEEPTNTPPAGFSLAKVDGNPSQLLLSDVNDNISNVGGDYYQMQLNILYNGIAMNSPDPTIVNVEIPPGQVDKKEKEKEGDEVEVSQLKIVAAA